MFEVSFEILLILLAAGFIAGFVDSIAGGGGLIALPAMLLAGVPPLTALATNKIQGLFGAATAAYSYAKGGHVDLRKQLRPACISFIASIAGALLVSQLPTDLIRWFLPLLLVGVALFFAFQRGLNDEDKERRMSPFVFSASMVPLIAAYDGLLGPGTGSFFMLAFVSLAGYGILKATAHTKLLNCASNAGALLAFAFVATPFWMTGLAMGVAQIFGARLGASLAQKIGARLIKPLLVFTTLAMAAKLLWDLI
ncbi:TSUP family transporter [Cognatishimia activa]|uniref:Probable membrane transporter protein n=1 Tax=Cognatishimia activa TaxID=1715691 RepID=A0A0P1ILH5_9RHOB|nr:TSUP family transporter [Cognatishimia activa]CUI58189.1 Sulfite exporter TauE/SafE [Cognatishimia activa]CUK24446.1 Sulfite exporter TauE/SafE [Cognatishimia activa]